MLPLVATDQLKAHATATDQLSGRNFPISKAVNPTDFRQPRPIYYVKGRFPGIPLKRSPMRPMQSASAMIDRNPSFSVAGHLLLLLDSSHIPSTRVSRREHLLPPFHAVKARSEKAGA
jgi:hypothetical protein